jgi:predicted transposase/invertase (TIGR01784 family)
VSDYFNRFRFYNRENGLCFEDIPEEVCSLELPKVPVQDDGTLAWGWAQFFRAKRREEFEMVAAKNPEIRKAVDSLYELSADEKVRAEYEMRQKAWRDRMSQNEGYYLDGLQEGRLEGRQEGMREGQLETAKRMKARGRPMEEIMEDTGLDAETLQGL